MRALPALAVAMSLAGCTRAEPPARPPSGPAVLRIAHESDVLSLDPLEFAETATHSVHGNVYEALAAFDRDMVLVPALATTWASLDDHTWQVDLRPQVAFHDGAPLTAQEVKGALLRARDSPASAVRNHLAGVREIEVVGELRLKLVTASPDPLLLNRLTYVLLARPTPNGLVGTGPYRVLRYEKGKQTELAAFARYWGGAPAVPAAVFLPIAGGEAAVAALEAGRVDVLRFLPPSAVERVRKLPAVRVLSTPGLLTFYLWINPRAAGAARAGPLASAKVRQALSLALDRREFVRRLGGRPATQLVQEGVFGHVPGLPPLEHDPARARALLAEAGYAQGFEVTLDHRDVEAAADGAALVEEMLRAVGVRVRRESPPWAELLKGWREGRIPFWYAGWRFESGDAHSFFVDCVMTRDEARRRGAINPGFSSPVLDRLIEEHATLFDEAARLRHYETLARAALAEMPHVPIYTQENVFAVSARVRWRPRVDGKLLAAEMALEP